MDSFFWAAPTALFPPLSPNPFPPPPGWKGELTAEFGFVAPTTGLLARSCNRYFAQRLIANGRRDDVAGGPANGGRDAARWGSSNPLPAPTTVDSPTVVYGNASQPPASSTVVGATKSNSAVNSPLAQRGERGWGRVGPNKAGITNQIEQQTPSSIGEPK